MLDDYSSRFLNGGKEIMYSARPKLTPHKSTSLLPETSSAAARIEAIRLKYHSPSPTHELNQSLTDLNLADTIQQRIESRLPGRIRNFQVLVSNDVVTLDGHCSTFHTKQMAQHIAMGVLDYERLQNNLEVRVQG